MPAGLEMTGSYPSLVSNDRTLTRNLHPSEPRREGSKTAWSNEMKARLVQLEQEERNKGRGFMSSEN